MALDPVFRALLDMPGMQFAAPPPEVTPAMMREMARQSMPPAEPPPIHSVSNTSVPGPAGAIPVRLYRPNATARLPLIVYFHGGGFVLCDLDSHDALCRSIANATGFAVASVDYRLAPEARFPEPLEDCYAALVALVARADEWGFDPARVAVCGDSAGGNLAAAVALLARDRKGPALRHQGLVYPVTDAACDDRLDARARDGLHALARKHAVVLEQLSRASGGCRGCSCLGAAGRGPERPAAGHGRHGGARPVARRG